MASELLPCPFCGSSQLSFRSTPDMDTDGKFHRISCNECGAASREKFAMETCPLFYEELRNAWNTRPTPVAPVSPDATGKCGELVTCVSLHITSTDSYPDVDVEVHDGSYIQPKDSPVAMVTRSQAMELLVAERAEKEAWKNASIELDKAQEAIEADHAAKVEQERLRFEGDLDKWMKIIGAGITGYQPEAYALMDLACEELVTLRADNAALTAEISAISGHLDCEADSDSILHTIREIEADKAIYKESAEAHEAKLAADEQALEPFAEYCGDHFDKDFNGNPLPDEQKVGWVYLNYGHFRRARAALGGKPS